MKWLGRQDSNLRYTGSKPDALPLGYAPVTIKHAAPATITGTQQNLARRGYFAQAGKGCQTNAHSFNLYPQQSSI